MISRGGLDRGNRNIDSVDFHLDSTLVVFVQDIFANNACCPCRELDSHSAVGVRQLRLKDHAAETESASHATEKIAQWLSKYTETSLSWQVGAVIT